VVPNPHAGIGPVQVRVDGSLPPKIEINGFTQFGPWADGPFPPPTPTGELVVVYPLP
jgi:hypothetical protein